jgi:hypothetical protein
VLYAVVPFCFCFFVQLQAREITDSAVQNRIIEFSLALIATPSGKTSHDNPW